MKTVVNNRACGVLYNFLMSNGITGGVLIPCNICETVPSTYWKAGLNIKFIDISCHDFMPDEDAIIEALENDSNIKIVHYNHTYGCIKENSEVFFKILKSRFPQIIVVDDRCLCVPEVSLVGNCYADVYLYSTGTAKIVDLGYGGFAHIKDNFNYNANVLPYSEDDARKFVEHIRLCQSCKKSVDKQIATSNWLKLENKIDDTLYFNQIEDAKVKVLEYKHCLNKIYDNLKGKLGDNYNLWRFQLLVDCQIKCLNAIFENGLFASKHYMSLGNGYFGDEPTPNADWLSTHIINLFNDYKFDREKAERVVDILGVFLH